MRDPYRTYDLTWVLERHHPTLGWVGAGCQALLEWGSQNPDRAKCTGEDWALAWQFVSDNAHAVWPDGRASTRNAPMPEDISLWAHSRKIRPAYAATAYGSIGAGCAQHWPRPERALRFADRVSALFSASSMLRVYTDTDQVRPTTAHVALRDAQLFAALGRDPTAHIRLLFAKTKGPGSGP